MASNGSPTVKQQIEATRVNHPDTIPAIGEPIDNSACWGNADNIGVFIYPRKIAIVDDGTFPEVERFVTAFEKTKTPADTGHYSSAQTQKKLGKFKYGLPDGVTLLGDKATLLHHDPSNYTKKIVFDVLESKRHNIYYTEEHTVTQEDIANAWDLVKKINPNAITFTVLKIENLREENTELRYKDFERFLCGLYSPDFRPERPLTLKLFNWIDEWSDEPTKICTDIDLSFGCVPCNETTINIYKNENGEKKIC